MSHGQESILPHAKDMPLVLITTKELVYKDTTRDRVLHNDQVNREGREPVKEVVHIRCCATHGH